uniref:Dynein light chain Tctex-type 1 n=1 Tax=Sarcophilus harrisii TaxID=9305 RepID=G3W1Z8_SARHA
MDDIQASEETSFVVDEVSNIVKEACSNDLVMKRAISIQRENCGNRAIESAIGGNAYQHSKVNQWTTNVVEQTLSQLTKLGKPFKYIVTCVIMQKNGAGLHTASSCFWDNTSDGSCTVRWENKTMYCIVSAFGLSI